MPTPTLTPTPTITLTLTTSLTLTITIALAIDDATVEAFQEEHLLSERAVPVCVGELLSRADLTSYCFLLRL